ncbi:hypothetical protein LPC08_24145 [Roseomonas sp. OT10]|uniref:hypothetical protein n=1 Tax=Roseomonas cutis TaxID=2897332 RepID=UPI001E424E7B|nr:hypothetical protein [Roseomonas sp. OT10]UFN49042.1 hypothetical protein LPC08_24145 [Roseomonas sp. OT10]
MRPIIVLVGVLLPLGAAPAQQLRSGPYRAAYCTLFEHRDMQGARLRLPNGERVTFSRSDVGNSAWREVPSWNDVASSATIDPGCHLRVWEHAMASGDSRIWHGERRGWNVNYFGDRWNDRISSATCHCD